MDPPLCILSASWAQTCLPWFVWRPCLGGPPLQSESPELHTSSEGSDDSDESIEDFGQFRPYEPDVETFRDYERRVNAPPPGRMPPRWPLVDFFGARASDH